MKQKKLIKNLYLMEIREILNEDYKIQLVIDVFETEIKKCKAIIARPMQGYSSVNHQIKIDKWTDRKEKLEELLNDILSPLN